MKIHSPNHLTEEESKSYDKEIEKLAREIRVSDSDLVFYGTEFLKFYKKIMEEHFSQIQQFVAFYSHYPYEVNILRLGEHGVMVFFTASKSETIRVITLNDFTPALTSINFFEIQERLNARAGFFDFRPRNYNAKEAERDAMRWVLDHALVCFWHAIKPADFEFLCRELIGEEIPGFEVSVGSQDNGIDAIGIVQFLEPGGFRRLERWAFIFKHHLSQRLSVNEIRKNVKMIKNIDPPVDIICLVTSGDVTSIGNHVSYSDQRIRIWDRTVLHRLLHQNWSVLSKHFARYAHTYQELMGRDNHIQDLDLYEQFCQKLSKCPPGKESFRTYEDIGNEILIHLFKEELGEPKVQSTSIDRAQRRDVLFRNKRNSPFFKRIAERFGADFVIVDYKNYSDPLDGTVVTDVAKYANKALGKFIVVVSRKGFSEAAYTTQAREFRDSGVIVLSVCDEHLLEMVIRKKSGEDPSDILEDLLDEMLINY